MTRGHRQGLSWGFTAAAAAVAGVVLFLDGVPSALAGDLLALTAVAAVLVGIRRNRPVSAIPWLLLAGALSVRTVADLLWTVSATLSGPRPVSVWWVALVSLGSSGLLGGSVLLLLRSRPSTPDVGALIDATIVAVGLGLVIWVWLLAPASQRGHAAFLEDAAAAAAPFFSLLVLMLALRLTIDAHRRPLACYLLLAGVLLRVVDDVGSASFALARGAIVGDETVQAAWLASSVLMGTAALHPTMRSAPSLIPAREPRLRRCRLGLLAASCLVAPVTLGIQALRGTDLHLPAALVAWVLMIALVLARMGGLVHQLGTAVHRLERSTGRERVVQRLGTALVAAQDRQAIYRAALSAARELLPDVPQTTLAIFHRRVGAPFAMVARCGTYPLGDRLPELEGRVRRRLRQGRSAMMILRPCPARPSLPALVRKPAGQPPPHPPEGERVVLYPLLFGGEWEAVLAVVGATAHRRDTSSGLAALASSSALALQRVALSEEVHRRRSNERLTALVRNTADLIMVVSVDGYVDFASRSAVEALGPVAEGRELLDGLAHPQDRRALQAYLASLSAGHTVPPLECRLRGPGGWRDYEMVGANLLTDPNVGGMVLTGRDITERKALQQQLHRRAMYDQLTGLANRALFGERVAEALDGPGTAAVLFIDLDDFKLVNDSMGHAVGDQVIAAAAARLAGVLRSGDTAARLGGDEFAVLLPHVTDTDEAKRVAGRVLQSFRAPFAVDARRFTVRASVGVAIACQPAPTVDELLRNADLAMYRAKATGKGCVACYEPHLHRGLVSRLEQQAQLASALQKGQIVPHYQPVVALSSDAVAGVEVLARWRHPDRGLLSAAEFLSVAEHTGLILPLGQRILDQACLQMADWRSRPGAGELFLSVNLCHRQLESPDLAKQVSAALQSSDLPAGALVLEVPEVCLLHDTREALGRLAELQGLGVQVAIAGFGTGSLSLSSLASMTADLLKLDRSLLTPPSAEPHEGALAAAVAQLVRGLRLPIVAQGVETEDQRASLRTVGCTYAQGLLFGEPGEPEVIAERLPRPHAVSL